jgi:superfamily II DNA or RNA helicase
MSDGDFTELDLPRVINTSNVDFVEEFYNPLLSRSIEYKRGVGFFRTSWIRSAARGVANLAENGGTAKWLTSPILSEDDWEMIKKAEKATKDEILYESLQDDIENLRHDLEYDTRNAVAWMVAEGYLEIKFALPTDELSGDFHDKFGIFLDENSNRVSFHGSQNDSQTALDNYEAYSIDCDWMSERDEDGVNQQEERFDKLWKGKDENVEVYDLPEGVENEIAELRDEGNRPFDTPQTPDALVDEENKEEITLRDYQREAVDSWFDNGCRGLFQMATGTGKSLTGLKALEEYLERQDKPVLSVIAVPVTHLAPQWEDEMDLLDLPSPQYLFGSANDNWKQDLSRTVSNVSLGIRDREFVITTHKTLSSEYFREKIQELDAKAVLIGDEVHRQGSESYRKGLMEKFTARIGLSATPERYYDEEGSEFLIEYFDGVIYEYTLEEAIPKHLTPYEYNPVIVEMNSAELEEYREMTTKLIRTSASDEVEDEVSERIAMKRADILKRAENKYDRLRRVLGQIDDIEHLLVYTNSEQIGQVQRILNEFGVVHHKFTYEEGEEERDMLLDQFAEGTHEALVAMKCLDEGVNVPATRTAVLMSNSGNPMQFIQRRGRVLRHSEGKERAVIYDMIVVPTLTPDDDTRKTEQNILNKELERFEEFAANALNEHSARNKIQKLRTAYRL